MWCCFGLMGGRQDGGGCVVSGGVVAERVCLVGVFDGRRVRAGGVVRAEWEEEHGLESFHVW